MSERAIGFDVAYFVLDEQMGTYHEGEADWADSVEMAKALGNKANCDFYIVFRTALGQASWGPAEQRVGIVYVSPLRKSEEK